MNFEYRDFKTQINLQTTVYCFLNRITVYGKKYDIANDLTSLWVDPLLFANFPTEVNLIRVSPGLDILLIRQKRHFSSQIFSQNNWLDVHYYCLLLFQNDNRFQVRKLAQPSMSLSRHNLVKIMLS